MENDSQLKVAAISDRGLSDKRPLNEDSYLSLEDQGVFAVADGVGGAQAGDVASQMAMEILGEAFIHYGSTAPPEETRVSVRVRVVVGVRKRDRAELPGLADRAASWAPVHIPCGGNVITLRTTATAGRVSTGCRPAVTASAPAVADSDGTRWSRSSRLPRARSSRALRRTATD